MVVPPNVRSHPPNRLKAPAARSVHALKVTLKGVEPWIWRRLTVPSDYSLADLHDVLQLAMGWTNSHLHQFLAGGFRYCPPDPEDELAEDVPTDDSASIRLYEVLRIPGARLVYEYDFGDSWEHDLEVETIRPAAKGEATPSCAAGERACPPEDCGGYSGYEDFLRAIQDPINPEHEEMLSWCGGSFDAEAFDRRRVNQLLDTYAARRRAWLRGPLPRDTTSGRYKEERIDLLARILEARDRESERQRRTALKWRAPTKARKRKQ